MSKEKGTRLIAYYLPQFHPIPENDAWWSKGFTEWTNVGKAKALFPGHYQPKVPADLGYYDLRVPETRQAQADLAKAYGIEGFCYWHYWFGNGKRLLERPFEEVLRSGEPDFPFCLAWANESWRGFDHGVKTKTALIEQLYPGVADYTAHFYAVLPAFKDARYMQIDGKPIFVIYHPLEHPEIKEFISLWQELAIENGLKGVHFIAQSFDVVKEEKRLLTSGFESINVVRLFDYQKKAKGLYAWVKWKHRFFRIPKVVRYNSIRPYLVGNEEYKTNVIPTIFPNWDHSPRSGYKALVLHQSTPENFDKHMGDVMERIKEKPEEHRMAFIKSWNEWAEGNYLEPDRRYGLKYLEVIKKWVSKP